jgi:hypothetical protein
MTSRTALIPPAEHQHQEQDQRRMADGPGRKVEALHRSLRKTIQLQKTTAAQFKPSSRGSEAIQGAGQVLNRFAASAFAFARGPKLALQRTRKL